MLSHADLLAEIPLFSLLDNQELATLAERIDVVQIPADQFLFRYGEPGNAMFVVRSGAVEISFQNDTGDKIVLEVARAGEFFGEISLLDGGPRTASAKALEDVVLLRVDRGDLDELIRLRPPAAMDLLTATGRRLRETSRILRHTASRNANIEDKQSRTTVMAIADWISDFSGSLPFLFIHVGIFFVWIVLNVRPLSNTVIGGFDAYPFGLLTMAVSLEAIVLSVFVLLSQNRQAERDRTRNNIEFDVNLKTELQMAQMHVKVDELQEGLFQRLERIEKAIQTGKGKA